MMLQSTGSSIYVFIAVVAVFLMGIAGGSLIYERRRDRNPQLATLGALLATAGGLAVVPMILSNLSGPRWLPVAVLLILPVTTIFGYTFPLTVRLFVGSAEEASRGVGLVYAANTAGCVAGTVLAGFVLIPPLGTSTAIITVGLVLAVAGGALAFRSAARGEKLRPAACLAAAAALLTVFFIPATKLTYVQNQIATTGLPTAHSEDSVASLDVTGGSNIRSGRNIRSRHLYINGTGITYLTIITKVLAYVAKAARPDATSMLNICFGMGATYRSSIILGLHTTAVELDPTVPSLMSWFYPDASKYLHSPLGHIIISDGRNYVRLSDTHYNLITVDFPPPIWSAGAVVLLTQEFYQEAAQRLTADGVFTTYIPKQQSRLEKMILRTIRPEFRHVSVVYNPTHNGTYIMGSQAPINFTEPALRSVFGSKAAQADLAGAPDFPVRSTAQWVSIIRHSVWLTDNQVNAYAGTGPVITDDHPLIEYFLHDRYVPAPMERPLMIRLALVVNGLLVLLILATAADSAARRRTRTAP